MVRLFSSSSYDPVLSFYFEQIEIVVHTPNNLYFFSRKALERKAESARAYVSPSMPKYWRLSTALVRGDCAPAYTLPCRRARPSKKLNAAENAIMRPVFGNVIAKFSHRSSS